MPTNTLKRFLQTSGVSAKAAADIGASTVVGLESPTAHILVPGKKTDASAFNC
jgi:hypothetical protein